MVKLLAKGGDPKMKLPVQVFMFWSKPDENADPDHPSEKNKIYVYATDIWNLNTARTEWMDDSNLPDGFTWEPSIDLVDDENVWEFPCTVEGEMAAHKKMCEIYAAELERIHSKE